MRAQYEQCLRVVFRRWVRNTRAELGISQQEMGRRLFMSERSYADREQGVFSCSALTLVAFLKQVCRDPDRFLDEVWEMMQAQDDLEL